MCVFAYFSALYLSLIFMLLSFMSWFCPYMKLSLKRSLSPWNKPMSWESETSFFSNRTACPRTLFWRQKKMLVYKIDSAGGSCEPFSLRERESGITGYRENERNMKTERIVWQREWKRIRDTGSGRKKNERFPIFFLLFSLCLYLLSFLFFPLSI